MNLTVLRLTTARDVDDLIADLRAEKKRAERHGGSRRVFRKDSNGRVVLHIEISLF